MRKDIDKVFSKGHTTGSKKEFNRSIKNERAVDALVKTQSMRKHLRYYYSHRNYGRNSSPLHNFLKKNVGQPWNKVHSEIFEQIDARSFLKEEIKYFLSWNVDQKVRIADDGLTLVTPLRQRNQHDNYSVNGKAGWTKFIWGFYVCPTEHTLKHIARPKYKRPSWPAKGIEKPVFMDGHVVQKIDGIWYEFEMKSVPEGYSWKQLADRNKGSGPWFDRPLDHFFQTVGFALYGSYQINLKEIEKAYGSTDVYCPSINGQAVKKQLSKKLLKKLGLEND